jgi:hypothetical protein
MKITLYKMLLGCAAVFGLSAIGCDDQVTQSDVNAARDEVREEAADVKDEVDEGVAFVRTDQYQQDAEHEDRGDDGEQRHDRRRGAVRPGPDGHQRSPARA